MRITAIALGVMLAVGAVAKAETVYEVRIYNSEFRLSGFAGGPFWGDYKPFDAAKKSDFLTFCIEDGVANLEFDKTYYATIDRFATTGATADSDGNKKYDYLDNETAALFYEWSSAASQAAFFAPFVNESSDVRQNNKDVQLVLWHFEGLTLANPTAFQQELINFGNSAALQKDYLSAVKVLNLWKTRPTHEIDEAYITSGSGWDWVKSNDIQSQLVLVPLPSAAWAGLGLLGVVGLRRMKGRVA